MELRQAARKQAKIKLALQGPSGAGKTMSALLLASGLTDWSKIAVIDKKNRQAYWKGKVFSLGIRFVILMIFT